MDATLHPAILTPAPRPAVWPVGHLDSRLRGNDDAYGLRRSLGFYSRWNDV